MGSRALPSEPGPESGPVIRRADPDTDAAACAAIYAPFVAGGAVSFEERPPDAGEIGSRIRAARAWVVAEHEGRVAGFAYATAHRPRAAYRWAVETSVYVAPAAQGQGLGRALYAVLLERLATSGFRTACAVIALPNPASVALHEAVGFEPAGVLRAIGYKDGAWRDVGWWQRPLGSGSGPPDPPPEPRW